MTACRPKIFRQVVNLYSTETAMFLRDIIEIFQKFAPTVIILVKKLLEFSVDRLHF